MPLLGDKAASFLYLRLMGQELRAELRADNEIIL